MQAKLDLSVPENVAFLHSLSKTEFRLALYLVRKFDTICRAEDIILFVWESAAVNNKTRRKLLVYVKLLRDKIRLANAPVTLENRHGVGYLLKATE